MMNSGPQKPPLAPKPKVNQPPRPGLSPRVPRRDGLPHPSPGAPRRNKPVPAPKPCLSKLTTAVESKPLISKRPQTAGTECPPTVGLLNTQNGLQQENKKPDWDYIIPICLCSQENCLCIKNSSIKAKKTGKDSKTTHKGQAEESRKTLPGPLDTSGDNKDQRDAAEQQAKNTYSLSAPPTSNKPLQVAPGGDKNLNTDNVFRPGVNAKTPPLHRTLSDEANANTLPNAGRGPQDHDLGSERTGAPQPKLAPPSPRKPVPVPVPRKPRLADVVRQERAEEASEEAVRGARQENDATEVKVSSEGKGSSSLSVSGPVSGRQQPIFLSATKGGAPPAPPARKKPLLSKPETAPTPNMPEKETKEDVGWDGSSYGLEMSVDEESEDTQKKEATISKAADDEAAHHQGSRPPSVEENRKVKVAPKKPQRNSNSMAALQKKDSPVEPEAEATAVYETWLAPPTVGVAKERVLRELISPPNEISSKPPPLAGSAKPAHPKVSKRKSKSFSAADVVLSDGQKRNSFLKILDFKLSVPRMLPKLMAKGGHSPDATATDNAQTSSKEQDQNSSESFRSVRKFSCPLIGVEQSVDGDELAPELEEAGLYENIPYYEEIPDYENVNVGKTESRAPSCVLQPPPWESAMYSDEGIYEEQEPYMSLVRTPGHQQAQTEEDQDERSSVDEEVAPLNEVQSDNDVAVNSSDEEEEEDSSSVSSKGEPEQPGETLAQSEKKQNKIRHIANEIMSSESVFVDVLKLLHVDFRDCVSQASRQNGKPVIEERHLDQVLYYLPQLYQLNQDLLRELKQRVAKWDEHAQLADIFLEKGPFLKMYSTYIREYDKNVALLEEQTKKNPAFGAVVRTFEASPRCANLALRHYLLKPVQRIPQYQLLLTDYLKNLSEDSCDYKNTQAALVIVKEVANHANDIMKQGDNFQKLIQVQCRLIGHREIVQPGRIFLKEGVLQKLARKVMQPRMFFLFNDVLLYTIPVQSGQFKPKNMLSLAGMKVSKPSQEAYQNELLIESVERSFIICGRSAAERDEWLEAISTAISEYTRKKITFIPGNSLPEGGPGTGDCGAPLGSKAPIWIPDPRTTMCMICTCEFTLTWRRHHCRACGKVVCQTCSSKKHSLVYLRNQPARVCDHCFSVLQEQKSESDQSAAVSPSSRATFGKRKQKKIPAALVEVSANAYDSSMSGYLQRSKSNKKQGKRLWFVIKDKVLYTYAASEDVAALESQPLLGFMLKENSSHKQQFELYHKNTLYYIFKADDVQTARRWIDSFKEATVL